MALELTQDQALIWESLKTGAPRHQPIARYSHNPDQVKKDKNIRLMLFTGNKPHKIKNRLKVSYARIYRIRNEMIESGALN